MDWCTAVEAGSVGASVATAAQVSQKDQGTQAYEAERLPVRMRLGTAQTYGGGGASRAAAAQAPEGVKKKPKKPTLPCLFAAARVCRGIQFVDEEGQVIKDCPMLGQGQCRRSHDPRACRASWTFDAEFLHKLDVYEDLVRRNENRVPSKAQLQDAGIIPNWKKAAPQKPAKGDVGVWSLPQRSRLSVDSYRSVSMYAGSPRGSAGDRHSFPLRDMACSHVFVYAYTLYVRMCRQCMCVCVRACVRVRACASYHTHRQRDSFSLSLSLCVCVCDMSCLRMRMHTVRVCVRARTHTHT